METTESDISASYLDILINIDSNSRMKTISYDFNSANVISPFICCYIPLPPPHGCAIDSIRKSMVCVRDLFKVRPTSDKKVDVAGLQ
jgi:hypothetical protein